MTKRNTGLILVILIIVLLAINTSIIGLPALIMHIINWSRIGGARQASSAHKFNDVVAKTWNNPPNAFSRTKFAKYNGTFKVKYKTSPNANETEVVVSQQTQKEFFVTNYSRRIKQWSPLFYGPKTNVSFLALRNTNITVEFSSTMNGVKPFVIKKSVSDYERLHYVCVAFDPAFNKFVSECFTTKRPGLLNEEKSLYNVVKTSIQIRSIEDPFLVLVKTDLDDPKESVLLMSIIYCIEWGAQVVIGVPFYIWEFFLIISLVYVLSYMYSSKKDSYQKLQELDSVVNFDEKNENNEGLLSGNDKSTDEGGQVSESEVNWYFARLVIGFCCCCTLFFNLKRTNDKRLKLMKNLSILGIGYHILLGFWYIVVFAALFILPVIAWMIIAAAFSSA